MFLKCFLLKNEAVNLCKIKNPWKTNIHIYLKNVKLIISLCFSKWINITAYLYNDYMVTFSILCYRWRIGSTKNFQSTYLRMYYFFIIRKIKKIYLKLLSIHRWNLLSIFCVLFLITCLWDFWFWGKFVKSFLGKEMLSLN